MVWDRISVSINH